jgi:hypothetical protein
MSEVVEHWREPLQRSTACVGGTQWCQWNHSPHAVIMWVTSNQTVVSIIQSAAQTRDTQGGGEGRGGEERGGEERELLINISMLAALSMRLALWHIPPARSCPNMNRGLLRRFCPTVRVPPERTLNTEHYDLRTATCGPRGTVLSKSNSKRSCH